MSKRKAKREKCESCGEPPTRHDADMVPLCDACYWEMAADGFRKERDSLRAFLLQIIKHTDQVKAYMQINLLWPPPVRKDES